MVRDMPGRRTLERHLSAAVFAVLLAGCAQLHWQRAGTDATAANRDLDECRGEARLRAARESWPFPYSAPRFVGGGQRQLLTLYPYQHDTDRFLLENDYTRACMRERGYELAPVEKPRPAQAEG